MGGQFEQTAETLTADLFNVYPGLSAVETDLVNRLTTTTGITGFPYVAHANQDLGNHPLKFAVKSQRSLAFLPMGLITVSYAGIKH